MCAARRIALAGPSIVVLFAALASIVWGQTPRFCGLTIDGEYIADGHLSDWQDPNAQPKLNGRPLFDAAKRVRFVRNVGLSPDAEPQAFVEMFGGDRFVGTVTGFASGDESPYERRAAEFVVAPAVDIAMPGSPRTEQLRVSARWAKRVVWKRQLERRYRPSTLFFRDGREVAFRRVRYRPQSLLLLVEAGPMEVPIDEIAELHLPRQDSWQAYFEQLAAQAVDMADPANKDLLLVRLETDEGLCVTASMKRLKGRSYGNANDANSWYRVIQPAWSMAPMAIAQRRIHTMRFTSPNEIPLSLLEPAAVEQKSLIGGGWPPRADRNVRDGFLRTGGKDAAWGMGMHANCRLSFALCDGARGFRADIGLDKSVGRGGCAKALIYLNGVQGEPLWQSKHLIGSQDRVATGELRFPPTADARKQLILVADAAHNDRPPGADPFDIRDMVDWCEPTLTLDPTFVLNAIAGRATSVVPAWEDWDAAIDGATVKLVDRWEERQDAGAFVTEVPGGSKPLVLSRAIRVAPEDRYLMLCVAQTVVTGRPMKLTIRVNREPYAEIEVPAPRWPGDTPAPRLAPIDGLAGRDVTLEIVHEPTDEKDRLAWRRIAIIQTPTQVKWTTLVPRRVKSAEGIVLSVLPDGSVLASGRVADRDLVTWEGDTKQTGITALRIEALTDETLPSRGPGRNGDGNFRLTEVRLEARPLGDEVVERKRVGLQNAKDDYHEPQQGASRAIDGQPQTGWSVALGAGLAHAATFEVAADPTSPQGTALTLYLDQQFGQSSTLGRFRVSVTSDPLPLPPERPGKLVRLLEESKPNYPSRRLTLIDEDQRIVEQLAAPKDKVFVDTGDRFAGGMSVRFLPGEWGQPQMPKLNAKVRAKPAPGEYRYLRFSWKKRGGGGASLQLASDGAWTYGAGATVRALRYDGGQVERKADGQAPIVVQDRLPDEWTVVTRDLFADFGAVNLTGMRFVIPQGELLVDRMQLTRTLEELHRPPLSPLSP